MGKQIFEFYDSYDKEKQKWVKAVDKVNIFLQKEKRSVVSIIPRTNMTDEDISTTIFIIVEEDPNDV